MVATVVSDADEYAKDVHDRLQRAGCRVDLDLRNETVSYKVRQHSVEKVPVILVVGKREAEEKTVTVRRLGSKRQASMPLEEALAMLADEVESKALPPGFEGASAS